MRFFYWWCFGFLVVRAIWWLFRVMRKGLTKCKSNAETTYVFTLYLLEIVSWLGVGYFYLGGMSNVFG